MSKVGGKAKLGGLSGVKPADDETKDICHQVKDDVEKQLKRSLCELIAIEYKTQVVAGVNYFIKARVSCEEYVHLKVYKSLPNAGSTLKLTGVQDKKSRCDPIEFF